MGRASDQRGERKKSCLALLAFYKHKCLFAERRILKSVPGKVLTPKILTRRQPKIPKLAKASEEKPGWRPPSMSATNRPWG